MNKYHPDIDLDFIGKSREEIKKHLLKEADSLVLWQREAFLKFRTCVANYIYDFNRSFVELNSDGSWISGTSESFKAPEWFNASSIAPHILCYREFGYYVGIRLFRYPLYKLSSSYRPSVNRLHDLSVDPQNNLDLYKAYTTSPILESYLCEKPLSLTQIEISQVKADATLISSPLPPNTAHLHRCSLDMGFQDVFYSRIQSMLSLYHTSTMIYTSLDSWKLHGTI